MKILFIILVFILGFYSGKARRKYIENTGEQLVNNILANNFPNEDYHLLKNITLPIVGGTTQIDHLLISTQGVFVIETKGLSNWIFGSEKQARWTQKTFSGKYKFQNPLHQNYKHIKELERYFDFLPENTFKSVIVFSGKVEFKSKMPENVVYLRDLVAYIQNFQKDTILLNRVFYIIGKLECLRKEVSSKTDDEHVKYLKNKYGSKTT